MTYADSVRALAPCGLSCEKCLAKDDGAIVVHSRELLCLLTNFERHAERFAGMNPVFAKYPAFLDMTKHLAQGNCKGCRAGECLHKGCRVHSCVKAKGVDFCFQCAEFPCANTGFDPFLHKRWQAMNERMREVGPEGFYAKTKDLPRY
ncbi:MAG: DUF3795 domain-containing protein [Desulfocurvibacter africanus]